MKNELNKMRVKDLLAFLSDDAKMTFEPQKIKKLGHKAYMLKLGV
jgi:hypothetical protein